MTSSSSLSSRTTAVTGATGALGSAVAAALGPAADRLVVRSPSRVPAALSGIEVRQASYGDRAACLAAFEGVDVLLLVSGAESATRREEHRDVVAAAAEAGVRHVVYTSFEAAAADAEFTLGRDHADTEEAVRASGMAWTFLRDTFYAEALPGFADEHGVIRGPAGDGRVAAVSRADVADVAVAVLRDPAAHEGVTLRLTGPEAFSVAEAAQRMTAVLGRPFSYVEETVDEAYASRRALSDRRWELDAWVSTYTAFASGVLAEVTGDVERIAGHRARTLEQALGGSRRS